MEEELIKRILPHSDDAERSVIGCMMMNREAIMIASEILTGDEFYRQQMGIVFDSMVELYNEGKPVDFVTLPEKLKEKDVPPEISSMEFAKDLLTAVPTSVNVGHYAKIVKEKAMLRRLIKMNEDIANTCYLDKEPVEEIMEDTEKQLFQLLQTRTGGDYVPIRQVGLNALETIEKASQTKGTVTGIPTGFVDLDYKTSGLQPSDFILVAARPAMGKTAFTLNIAQNVAMGVHGSVAFFFFFNKLFISIPPIPAIIISSTSFSFKTSIPEPSLKSTLSCNLFLVTSFLAFSSGPLLTSPKIAYCILF